MNGLAGPTGGPGRPPEPLLPHVGPAERELAEAIEHHRRWQPAPCQTVTREVDLWLSPKQAEREKAAAECERCPFVELCFEAALELGATWGVWGAQDFSTPSPQKARPRR